MELVFRRAISLCYPDTCRGPRIRVGYVSDTDTRGIRAGCVPAAYRRLPERIGLETASPVRFGGWDTAHIIPPRGLPVSPMPYRIQRAATPSVRTHEGDAAGGGWPPAGDEPAGDEPPATRRSPSRSSSPRRGGD